MADVGATSVARVGNNNSLLSTDVFTRPPSSMSSCMLPDFSTNSQKTIERLDGSEAALGNQVGFSQVDINKLNKMYQCDITATTTTVATTTAATTAPATTTNGPATTISACTDSFPFCRRFRRFCGTQMGSVCRKTCNLCVECEDESRYESRCSNWASAGYCTGRYEGFMTENCKKSCGHCNLVG